MKWNLYSHFVSGLEFGRIFQRDKFELVPYRIAVVQGNNQNAALLRGKSVWASGKDRGPVARLKERPRPGHRGHQG